MNIAHDQSGCAMSDLNDQNLFNIFFFGGGRGERTWKIEEGFAGLQTGMVLRGARGLKLKNWSSPRPPN